MSVQSSLVMYPIYEFGSPEHKEKFLPSLGIIIVDFCALILVQDILFICMTELFFVSVHRVNELAFKSAFLHILSRDTLTRMRFPT